eukprot:10036259-Lingulodinium_polyedra.AAC.1
MVGTIAPLACLAQSGPRIAAPPPSQLSPPPPLASSPLASSSFSQMGRWPGGKQGAGMGAP